jgi:hypothetical protein
MNKLTEQQKARIVELANEMQLCLAYNGGQAKAMKNIFIRYRCEHRSAEAFRIAKGQ